MDKSRISRSHYCNIHTDQVIISVCLESACFRPTLCLACINDEEIHPSTHPNIISLEEFFFKVDKVNDNKQDPKSKDVQYIKQAAEQLQECVASVDNKVEFEKRLVEDAVNELITNFLMKCHAMKEEMMKNLERQAEIFRKNYKAFAKLAKKIPDPQKIVMKQSSFTEVNKSLSYNQLENLVKRYQKELVDLQEAPQQGDENLNKLKTIAKTLLDDASSPITTNLTNTTIETVKEDLNENTDKFLAKYMKLPKELSVLEFAQELKYDSKIVNKKEFSLIKTFLKNDYRDPEFNVLYRGSRDGFTSAALFDKCEKGSTLLLIKSATNKVFGGYTDADWVVDDQYKTSSKSFLFSMDHKEKYPLKSGHHQYATKASQGLGPCFGGGHDLRITADFKNDPCSGYIGFSYDAYGKYGQDIYGDMNFLIDEIELYKVIDRQDDDNEDDNASAEEHKFEIENPKVKEYSPLKQETEDWEELLLKQVVSDEVEEEKSAEKKSETGKQNQGTPSISSLATYEDLEVLLDWIDKNRNFTLDLVYKGSKHGYSASDFHKKCDKVGPTVTLIKSKKFEQVFGGFTKQPWDQTNQPAECAETFLFSLTKKKKFPIADAENAIFKSVQSGPVFGNGDIFICSDCNKKAESYSNLGVGFDVAGLDDSIIFFADEQYFIVDEIEVFQVIFFE